jgi:hypothetical protein
MTERSSNTNADASSLGHAANLRGGELTKGEQGLLDSAKWIIATFGAVGGALIAGGIPLSNIGVLKLTDPRLYIAVVAAALALFSIGLVIFFAARILGPVEALSLPKLAREEDALDYSGKYPRTVETMDIKYIRQEAPHLLGSFASVRELAASYNAVKRRYDGLYRSSSANTELEFSQYQHELGVLEAQISELLIAVRYNRLYQAYQISMHRIFPLAFLAGMAVVVFVWAANPPLPGVST